MDELCMFDNEPEFADGMCEECFGEAEYMATCDACLTTEYTRVVQGRINAYYTCQECGNEWM